MLYYMKKYWFISPEAANYYCSLKTQSVQHTLKHIGLQGGPFLNALTVPNIDRFSKLFHCQNPEKICNNTITKDLTYTTL